MSANVICGWCLVVMRRDVPELEKDSHGICDKCATETFSELTRDALAEMEEPKTLADIEAGDLAEPDDHEEYEPDPENENARVERDNDRRAWSQEIAREEGMLGGIEAFNDWGGNFYE